MRSDDPRMMRRNGEAAQVRGYRKRLLTSGVAPNLVLLPTPLIRANLPDPRQLLVTVMPPTKGDGVTPYASTFDGAAYPPVGGNIFTAPVLPGVLTALQVLVMWGAGGIRYQTAFDYPAVGGTFSITADSLDVSVGFKGNPAPIVFASENEVPVVAAQYVEGAPVDPTPMAWLETPLALGGLADAFYAIKPFTEDVNLWVGTTGAAVERYGVEFLNTAGATLVSADFLVQAPGSDVRTLQVPRQATVMRVVNRTAVAKTVSIEWGIGLS